MANNISILNCNLSRISFLNNISITNCIFSFIGSVYNSQITNSIYRNTGLPSVTSTNFTNNLCFGCNLTPGSNNQNVSSIGVFVNDNPSIDKDFQLAVGSPAIGAGTGGTNCGIFGGANPYVLSGLPPYPITTNLTTSGAGNASTPLQVSITVRGNN